MVELFRDLLQIEDVEGALFLSPRQKVLFQHLSIPAEEQHVAIEQLSALVRSLEEGVEADFLFEYGRVYIRGSTAGHLIVVLGAFAPIAMIRLQCDVLLPALASEMPSKGLRRFFRRTN